MGKQKLTPWFKHDTQPVRTGVYAARQSYARDIYGYAFFDAEAQRWAWLNGTVKEANQDRVLLGASQNKEWRGLAEQPK